VQHLEAKSGQGTLEGAIMTGEDVREVFETILPQQDIEQLCAQFGVIERQRKLHLGMLVRAMVIAAGTPGGAYQADVLRSYLEGEVPRVARSAFYRWFDEPLERFMAALAERALAYARAQQVDLTGILGGVKDWYIVLRCGKVDKRLIMVSLAARGGAPWIPSSYGRAMATPCVRRLSWANSSTLRPLAKN
jgi:hypothetical protein